MLCCRKVADSLCAGGYFVATVPDPSRTEECTFGLEFYSSLSLAFPFVAKMFVQDACIVNKFGFLILDWEFEI